MEAAHKRGRPESANGGAAGPKRQKARFHHGDGLINSGALCSLLQSKRSSSITLQTSPDKEKGKKKDMGGSKAASFFCLFFKFSGRSRYRNDDADWEPRYTRKIRHSDEDRGRWVGEHDVDEKASDFIARFYKSRSLVA